MAKQQVCVLDRESIVPEMINVTTADTVLIHGRGKTLWIRRRTWRSDEERVVGVLGVVAGYHQQKSYRDSCTDWFPR